MRSLQHPNVLPLLACFLAKRPGGGSEYESWLWLVLPFISGGSVLTLLQSAYPQVPSPDTQQTSES